MASSIGAKKLGQPVPLSNLVSERKSGRSQAAQANRPGRCSLSSALECGRSVPRCRSTRNCSGVNTCFHSASVFDTSNFSTPPSAKSLRPAHANVREWCIPATPQLKRERSLLANFGPAGGSYHKILKYIARTWPAHAFLSSSLTCPARQCGLCDEITLASLQGAPPKRCPRAGQRPCRAYKRLRRLWSYTAAFPRLSYSIKTRLSSQSHMSDRSPHLCV